MGATFIYQTAKLLQGIEWAIIPYFSISLSLNVLLTLMIIIRLILHARSTRTALGIAGIGGLCKAVITMLVESCAIFTVNSLLVVGPLGASNVVSNLFTVILGQTQVSASRNCTLQKGYLMRRRIGQIIAPLLIIRRIADKSALTRNTVVSGRISEFKATTSGEFTGGSGAPPAGDSTSSVDE